MPLPQFWTVVKFLATTSSLFTLALSTTGDLSSKPRNSDVVNDAWYHPSSHPVHSLFRRDGSFPPVGSDEWISSYPSYDYNTSLTPDSWTAALNTAISNGLIPSIPPTTVVNGLPTYPSNVDPTSGNICSATYQCRADGDVWDAPNGTIGIGFDDGPLLPSEDLYNFLSAQNQRSTHFMIGSNILYHPDLFTQAYSTLQDDIAVHTWTHPYMTSKSNAEVLAELGWTMQIIHDSTEGRVPRFWRPPYGDADERVRAIAREVFGLSTIIWNHDSNDWRLSTNGTTSAQVSAHLNTWITGPKSPGLIILEHELSNASVQCFMDAYPSMASQGWTTSSVLRIVPALDGNVGNVYWNADTPDQGGAVSSMGILDAGESATLASTESASTKTATPTGTETGTGLLAEATGTHTVDSRPHASSGSGNMGRLALRSSTWIPILLIWFMGLVH